jgi:hypothetical protein
MAIGFFSLCRSCLLLVADREGVTFHTPSTFPSAMLGSGSYVHTYFVESSPSVEKS